MPKRLETDRNDDNGTIARKNYNFISTDGRKKFQLFDGVSDLMT